MSNSKYSGNSGKSKGYAFTFEAAMALLLVLGFLGIAMIYPQQKESYTSIIESKELMTDLQRALDENGFTISVLDQNFGFSGDAQISDAQIENLYATMKDALPATLALHLSLEKFDPNKENCILDPNKTFDVCFTKMSSFPDKGDPIPNNRETVSTSFFLVKKSQPGQCSIQFEGKEKSEKSLRAFFGEPGPIAYFDAGGSDVNIVFTTTFTPNISELSCDQSIQCDLNAYLPGGGRKKADVMLSLAKSGSTSGSTQVDFGIIKNGSFDQGAYTGNCANHANWQLLTTVNVDFNAQDFTISMDYNAYIKKPGDKCDNPRLRLVRPTGAVYDDSNPPLSINITGSAFIEGTWQVWGWSDKQVDYNIRLSYKAKDFDFEKKASKDFINNSMWNASYDQLGLFSYEVLAIHDVNLSTATDANKTLIKNKIEALDHKSNSRILPVIQDDRAELTTSPRARTDAMRFIVVLADDQTGIGGTSANLINEANLCKTNNITIYAIGFGSPSNSLWPDLNNMANITGGKFYYVKDFNTLNQAYTDIGYQIGYLLTKQKEAYNAHVKIEVPAGARILDTNGATQLTELGKYYLDYSIGTLKGNQTWLGHFNMQYDCNSDAACNSTDFNIPGNSSQFIYTDENGTSVITVPTWEKRTIILKFRDLQVAILRGYLAAVNSLFLDLNASNVGQLDSASTTVELYWSGNGTDLNTLMGTLTVPVLGYGSFQMFYDKQISKEGWIIAIINRNGLVKECPKGNIAKIQCTSGTKAEYYKLSVWVWRK